MRSINVGTLRFPDGWNFFDDTRHKRPGARTVISQRHGPASAVNAGTSSGGCGRQEPVAYDLKVKFVSAIRSKLLNGTHLMIWGQTLVVECDELGLEKVFDARCPADDISSSAFS